MHDNDPTSNKDRLSIMPELSPELAATYENKDPYTIYELGCGDDRAPTPESHAALVEEGADATEAMLRYYGGLAGVTRVLILTLLAQERRDLIDKEFSGSFVDVMKNVKSAVEAANNNVRLELHTAEASEGNPAYFDPNSQTDVGCAYAANVATIGAICATDPNHADLTQQESQSVYNTPLTASKVQVANDVLNATYFADPDVVGLTREDFTDVKAPIQVLKGGHADPNDTLVAINFTTDKLSNPTKAAAAGTPFYNNDVTQVAEMLIRTYPDFELDPTIMFAVMDQDIRATRAALTGGDATALKQARIGDPEEAIAYLKSIQANPAN
jgi:hypothetical protein